MPRYRIPIKTVASATLYVEAESKKDAEKQYENEAMELPWLGICCTGSSETHGYTLELGEEWELDGEVEED